jgi:hypothetical protein
VAGTCGYGEGLSGSINVGKFLTSCKVYWLASQEGLCSMEYVSTYHVSVMREYEELNFLACKLTAIERTCNIMSRCFDVR